MARRFSQSEAMWKRMVNQAIYPPFQVKPKVKYLGIVTDGTLKNLYKFNYLPLLQKIEKDLAGWTTLPLSLIGRVNVIKMNIFPDSRIYSNQYQSIFHNPSLANTTKLLASSFGVTRPQGLKGPHRVYQQREED